MIRFFRNRYARNQALRVLAINYSSAFLILLSAPIPNEQLWGLRRISLATIEDLQRDFRGQEGKLIVVGGITGKLCANTSGRTARHFSFR